MGDMFQLPPVKPPIPVYHRYANRENTTQSAKDTNGEHIWHEALKKVILLNKNFRQEDPEFLKICRAVREGKAGEQHVTALNKRIITKDNTPPPDALYIYPTNDQVHAANVIMTHRHAQANNLPVIRLLAKIHPCVVNPTTTQPRGQRRPPPTALIRNEEHRVFSGFTAAKATPTSKRTGVLSILDLHFGAPVILCNVGNSLQVSYNISNNSTGTFVGFWPPTSNTHFTGKRNVRLIDDNTSGTVYYPAEGYDVTHLLIKIDIHGGKGFQMPGLPENVYAMARTKGSVKCQDGHHHVVEQFRIRLFYSSTADKIQGQSIDRPVVLGGLNNKRSNYLYVVLTRVHRLLQLYIAQKLTINDMARCGPDYLLQQEMKRLERLEKATLHLIRTCPQIGTL
jgi:hypothetical protein